MTEPKATKPDISTKGDDTSSTSTATVNEANSTTTVKANYSLNTKGKDESKKYIIRNRNRSRKDQQTKK